MSRLSDALGVPEGKPFEFRGAVYVIKGNRRYFKMKSSALTTAESEEGLTSMLDNASEIKLLPARYKRKEPGIVEVYRVGDDNVPTWAHKWLHSLLTDGDYLVLDSTDGAQVYTAEGFESTFEEINE